MSERAPLMTASGSWQGMREKLRDIIRTEVARFDPTEDARHPLELIVETSVRYAETDGEARITVMDESGRPRMTEKDGEAVPFTLQDLIEELRRDHPILFNPPHEPHAKVAGAAPEGREARRDWLDIGSHGLQDRPARAALISRLARLPWNRKNPAARTVAAIRDAESAAEAPGVAPRDVIGLDKPAQGRGLPGAAIGTVALAGVLAVGLVAFLREEPARDHSEGPATTGAVEAARTAEAAPPAASTPMQRTLRGVPEVIDTTTLSLEGEVVRLFGIEWAPGAGKPDDLTRYLQGREVVCEPAGANDIYRCKVGGQDLSRVVLFNGGGKATPEAGADLKAAADKAREARVGVWGQ